MPRFRYFVVKSGTNWEIKFDGQTERFLYQTQAQAMQAAKEAARANWDNHGRPSEVTIQGTDGQWRASDTYGNDPNPPRG